MNFPTTDSQRFFRIKGARSTAALVLAACTMAGLGCDGQADSDQQTDGKTNAKDTDQQTGAASNAPKIDIPEPDAPANPRVDEALTMLPGFQAEVLYDVPGETQGSWVVICNGPDGTLFVADQYGETYRVTPPPIGDYETKQEVRDLAHKFGLPVFNKPDSQEICFVPDNDYRGFLKRRVAGLEERVAGGDFVDTKMEAIGAYESQFYNPNSKEPATVISSKNFTDSIRYRSQDMGRLIGAANGEGFISAQNIGVKDLMNLTSVR